ncbi:MAG: hypothetical protein ACXITV_02970 [Luteibaculaceae bacterium]
MSKTKKNTVKIEGWGEMDFSSLLDIIKDLKTLGPWTLEKWKAGPALVDKNGGTSRQYIGQIYDPNFIDLVPDGWTHDHCEVCSKSISDKERQETSLTQGFKSENSWICEQCYTLFMLEDDLEKELRIFLEKKG